MTTPPPSDGTAGPPDWVSPQRDIFGNEVRISGQETEDAAKHLIAAANLVDPKAQPKIKVRKKLEPAAGSDLSLLFTQLPELEAAKNDAETALKEHKKKIQQEIARTIADPQEMPDVFDIPADPHGGYPAYTLAARQGAWRLNAEAMKNEDPATYVKWAVQGEPYWELSRVRKNRVKR